MQCKELSDILHHNYAAVKKNVQKTGAVRQDSSKRIFR